MDRVTAVVAFSIFALAHGCGQSHELGAGGGSAGGADAGGGGSGGWGADDSDIVIDDSGDGDWRGSGDPWRGDDSVPGPAPGEGVHCPPLPSPSGRCETRGDGICDADELRRRLERASPGDTLRVGRCRVSGTFTVPAGVTLTGAHPEQSVVVAPSGGPAIVLSAGDRAASARCLSVESAGTAGVLAASGARASIEHVHLSVVRGIGIGAEEVRDLRIHGTTLIGPVTPENADSMPLDPTPRDTATHGIVLAGVVGAQISDVVIDGFAKFGLLAIDSDLTLRGAAFADNLGTGLMAFGGHACMRGVRISGTLQGGRLIPAYGIVAANDSEIRGRDVEVVDGQGYGILQTEAAAGWQDLVASGNRNAAMWVQSGTSLHVVGEGTRIADNYFAGIVVCRTPHVTIEHAEIARTRLARRLAGEVGTVEIGDGLMIGYSQDVTLRDLALVDNERVGLVVVIGGDSDPLPRIENVRVSSMGRAFGAVALYGEPGSGGAVPLGGWDDGIRREGAAATNDAAFAADGRALHLAECVLGPWDYPDY